MTRWFMMHGGDHHIIDEGLYLHFPDTCDVHDVCEVTSANPVWAPHSTMLEGTRLAPSRLGWVAICYETKGIMTFFVQLNTTRAAWQRIKWPAGFDKDWDEEKIKKAIENFLWVAECEEARKILPR